MSKRKAAAAPAPSSEDMRIEYTPILTVLAWPRNPKAHDAKTLDASIERFGFNDPPAIDEGTGHLVEGHGRIEALERRMKNGSAPPPRVRIAEDGSWLVPIVRGVRFKDELEAEAYVVAHNRIGEGLWENAILAEVLAAARELSLDGMGYSSAEAEKIISRAADESTDTIEDEVPDLPAEATCKLGEVWILGEHRLLVGSCEGLALHVAPESARLMITDPPYGVSYESAGRRGKDNQHAAITNDELDGDALEKFFTRCFSAVRALLAPGAAYYVTGPQGGNMLLLLLLGMRAAGMMGRHELIWAKNQIVFGRGDYHYQHEPIIYGWIEGAGHCKVEDRTQSSVWQIDKPRRSDLHPTMKPVELYARAMRNSSARGALVLEPFAGSGTALIAAEQLGRKVAAAELDPRYCDVIIERWQNLSGGKAVRA